MIELSLLSATAILNNCKRFAIGEIRGAARDPFWTTLERIKPHLHDTTGCQSGLLNEQLFVQHGCQTRLTTGCIVYTNIQPVVSCKWGLSIHNFSDIDVSTEKNEQRAAIGRPVPSPGPRLCVYSTASQISSWRKVTTHVHVRYMLSPVRLSSVTFVRPTQAVQIFGNISTALGTLAISSHPLKILRRSSQGNPSAGRVEHKRGSQV